MANMLENEAFFTKYNLPPDSLEKTGLARADLEAIYSDHSNRTDVLEFTADYVAARLRRLSAVHSIKIRIKDPEHLIEKIIRKKLEDHELEITPENYKEKITDLIGVRALHLFKEDWTPIHDFVEGTWSLHEQPIANVRKGDPDEYTQQFVDKGCRINEHKYGYRSVHYLIESQPAKDLFITELQVRTIFEEGWSEIDHRIRYPYDLENVILTQLSAIHNRLAGSADEIGSFIKILKSELKARDEQMAEAVEKHAKAVVEINAYVQKLEISNKKKKELEDRLQSLSQGGYSNISKAIASMMMPSSEIMRAAENQRRIADAVAAIGASFLQSGAVARAAQPIAKALPSPATSTSAPIAEGTKGQTQEVTGEAGKKQSADNKPLTGTGVKRVRARNRGRRTNSASKQKGSKE